MLRRIYTVQIQPMKHVLDHAEYTAPTRQHELDHTDHTDHTDQESIYLPRKIWIINWLSAPKDLDHQLAICPERSGSSTGYLPRKIRIINWLSAPKDPDHQLENDDLDHDLSQILRANANFSSPTSKNKKQGTPLSRSPNPKIYDRQLLQSKLRKQKTSRTGDLIRQPKSQP